MEIVRRDEVCVCTTPHVNSVDVTFRLCLQFVECAALSLPPHLRKHLQLLRLMYTILCVKV
jgi:hypothetical protein